MGRLGGRAGVAGAAVAAWVAAGMLWLLAAGAWAEEIKIGGLFDLTGPTADVGRDYQAGALAAERYLNQQGGIGGTRLRLLARDYGYRIPEAVSLYKRFRDGEGVLAIQGWGTGDTNALRPMVARDAMVFFSASYDGHLADPRRNPYNFFIASSYSDNIRSALAFAKERGARKFVFIYPDNSYGKNPIPAGKAYAQTLGIEVGPDEIVDLTAMDTTSQLLNLQRFDPDFAWIGGTTASTAVILRDAARLGIRTKFMINVWGFDENLPRLAGPAAEGRAFGVLATVPFGDDVPGMKAVAASAGGKEFTLHYVKSWVSMLVMAEGLKRAQKAGRLHGPGLKAALETLRDFDTGGLVPPITFTPEDHRPHTKTMIGEIGGGRLRAVQQIEIPRQSQYLGN